MSLKFPKIFRSKHKVAVIGIYRSGKTAFITSFINHVMHHDSAQLKIGDPKGSVKIVFGEEFPVENGFARFPYGKFRIESNGKWPLKTKDVYQYSCSFYRSDWRMTKGQLDIIDFPGERLADIAMVKRSYAEWSDWLFNKVFQDKQYRDIAQTFLAECDRDVLDEKGITLVYRQFLADLFKSYRPVITPSTFLLQHGDSKEMAGKFFGVKVDRGDISSSFSGLSEDEQFVPLPAKARKNNIDLEKRFASHYSNYRDKVAIPLTKILFDCNELAILVDVTTLLAANTGMYNGNRELLNQFFQILSPGDSLFGMGMDWFRILASGGHWRKSGSSQVAIIATKSDKVHVDERDKLKDLVKEMTIGLIEKNEYNSSRLDYKYFACSAIKSTWIGKNGRLQGRLLGEEDKSEYDVSKVPENWPGKWEEGDFNYPDVAPEFPEIETKAPDHLAMDDVIEFLLK